MYSPGGTPSETPDTCAAVGEYVSGCPMPRKGAECQLFKSANSDMPACVPRHTWPGRSFLGGECAVPSAAPSPSPASPPVWMPACPVGRGGLARCAPSGALHRSEPAGQRREAPWASFQQLSARRGGGKASSGSEQVYQRMGDGAVCSPLARGDTAILKENGSNGSKITVQIPEGWQSDRQ
jgi:hypothetical protein